MKFSEFIGKKVICMAQAKELGVVFNAVVDKKIRKLQQFILVDEDENEGYVQTRNINFGDDTLFTTYALADYDINGIAFPFRASVFDTDGKFIGRVFDFEFEANNISAIVLQNDIQIPTSQVVVAGDNLVIIKGNRKVVIRSAKITKPNIQSAFTQLEKVTVANSEKLTLQTQKLQKQQIGTAVEVATIVKETQLNECNEQDNINDIQGTCEYENCANGSENNGVEQDDDKKINSHNYGEIMDDFTKDIVDCNVQTSDSYQTLTDTNEIECESPRKVILGYQFLLGRKVEKQILSGGKLLIAKGQIIDENTVELARRFGKLLELTISSIG